MYYREVLQLHSDIRDSSELHFVRCVHSALSSNNYIRFFKLVGQATFLQACIMHRYFGQVRVKALQIMVKAYKNNTVGLHCILCIDICIKIYEYIVCIYIYSRTWKFRTDIHQIILFVECICKSGQSPDKL
jgi:hypothetical protein